MTENFLQYIWQFKLFSHQLHLVSGEAFDVISSGERNTDAGPDFFNAKIKIENTIWAGNVEIHVNASDWEKHRHQTQKEYDNIILHVVYRNDKPVFGNNRNAIPTFELKNHLNPDLWKRYQEFMETNTWIACENLLPTVDEFTVNAFQDRLLIERLERKTQYIEHLFNQTNNNWIEAFYKELARNMGFRLNNQAFEMLAKSISFIQLLKHADNPLQIEALIFGQAGMLNEVFEDAYPKALQQEYRFLKQKFSLNPIDKHLWRFMRIHPSNFPTIRLAQFARLICRSQNILAEITEMTSVNEVGKLFNSDPNPYWLTHYQFDKTSPRQKKSMGKESIHLLIINFVIPFLYIYGKMNGNPDLMQQAVALLETLPPEKNTIIRQWEKLGIKSSNAATTQSLLELKNSYCNFKKCLNCRIGTFLIR